MSRFIDKQQADILIKNHRGLTESKMIGTNGEKITYRCILWGDWFEETDAYGHKSQNRIVKDEFFWQEERAKDEHPFPYSLPFTALILKH